VRALAHAKVNLSLQVDGLRPDGFHALTSLFQSVSLSDRLELESSEEDGVTGWRGEVVPDGDRNLAWRAVAAVRRELDLPEADAGGRALRLRLAKRIPMAAGMGGGSADAAAALHLAVRVLGTPPGVDAAALVDRLAPSLGSDVPFCARGGTAMVTGRGETVHPLEPLTGFALGIVVPPIELSTPAVFSAWDRLGTSARGQGVAMGPGGLPPSVRDHGPLRNDLYPAATSLAPEVDDWRRELESAWGRPVAMSGSGPTLFAFFVDLAEATDAGEAIPPGARTVEAVVPVAGGWSWDRDEDR
jgi:4-diphosphocytidyl-2-C-methyl-D-erythritol kinase